MQIHQADVASDDGFFEILGPATPEDTEKAVIGIGVHVADGGVRRKVKAGEAGAVESGRARRRLEVSDHKENTKQQVRAAEDEIGGVQAPLEDQDDDGRAVTEFFKN